MSPETVQDVAALQRACFPPPFPEELLWTPAHLFSHLRHFPAGQFVARTENQVVGSASSLIISQAAWESHGDWETVTGGLGLSNHDPAGAVLYGADISVHPSWRGRGVAKLLYQARFELVRRLGLELYGTVCRIPDFVASGFSHPLTFADAVAHSTAEDRTLSPLLKMGLTYRGIIEKHMDDPESGHAAAILEWRP